MTRKPGFELTPAQWLFFIGLCAVAWFYIIPFAVLVIRAADSFMR